MNIITEGKAKIYYPKEFLDQLSSKLEVFYNPAMRINRDFTLIIILSYYLLTNKKLRILDSMAATGIRSIRILKEIGEVVDSIIINDISDSAISYIKKNLELNKLDRDNRIVLSNKDCKEVMLKEKFDYIDIDPFGTPVGFIQPAALSLKNNGILGVTATDISALSGSREKAARRKYGIIGYKTDFYLEFGLRTLIKYVIEEAARFDIALKPIFGYYYQHHYRVFFLKSRKSKDINYLLDNIQFIDYCKNCHFKKESYREGYKCKICGSKLYTLGPIYLGRIFDDSYIKTMDSIITGKIDKSIHIGNVTSKIFDLIINGDYLADKNRIWWYYDIHKIAKTWKIKEIPKREEIKKKFQCYHTHFTPTGLKCMIYPKII